MSECDNDSVLRAAKQDQEDFKDLLRDLIEAGLCLSWRIPYLNAHKYAMSCNTIAEQVGVPSSVPSLACKG